MAVGSNGGNSRQIAYLNAKGGGEDPGLFWLSGFHSEMTSVKAAAMAEWAAGRRRSFLRFDYSGDGRSSGRAEDAAVGDWVEEAEAVFRAQAQGAQIVIGSSMGAWIALLLARRLAENPAPRAGIAALVFIAPAWDMTEGLMWPAFSPAIRQTIMEEGVYWLPSRYDGRGHPISRRLIEDGRRHLIADAPLDPGCPLRIIHGMEDADVPWMHSVRLAQLLPSADIRLTLVKDAEHRLARPQDLALLTRTIENCQV